MLPFAPRRPATSSAPLTSAPFTTTLRRPRHPATRFVDRHRRGLAAIAAAAAVWLVAGRAGGAAPSAVPAPTAAVTAPMGSALVVVPVDAAVADLATPGSAVDLVRRARAGGPPVVIATGARVVAVRGPTGSTGMFSSAGSRGRAVVLATDPAAALRIAGVPDDGGLGVVIRPA